MKTNQNLTAERLREVCSYCQETGVFTRKSTGVPLVATANGYLVAKIDGRVYALHRLAFLYMTGAWPKEMVDHIDGVKNNNRWTNLRDVSNCWNQQNRQRPGRRNKTGFLGVTRRSVGKPFAAHISIAGKVTHLGCFDTAEAASAVYFSAKRQHHEGNTLGRSLHAAN